VLGWPRCEGKHATPLTCVSLPRGPCSPRHSSKLDFNRSQSAVTGSSTVTCDTLIHVDTKSRTLERQIEKVKRELAQVGELRPGTLSEQYNVCGTPRCRCKGSSPKKHGPYYQLSYTRKGKSHTRFIRPEALPEVKQQIKNYARFRTLVEHWIDVATELGDLRLAEIRGNAPGRK